METTLAMPNLMQKILLACGILAALLYVGTDILAGLLKTGYHFDTQSAGVLSAIGSPTRSLEVPLDLFRDAVDGPAGDPARAVVKEGIIDMISKLPPEYPHPEIAL